MSLQSLRIRMTLVTAGAMLMVLLVLAGGVLLFTSALVTQQETQALQAQAATAGREVTEHGPPGLSIDSGAYSAGTYYLLWDTQGGLVQAPAHVDTAAFRRAADAAAAGRPSVSVISESGGRVLVDSRLVGRGDDRMVLQTARQLTVLSTVENELAVVVAAAGGSALVVALLAAWFLAGRWVAPVERSLERERAFVADASHELRTPLAIVDASLQVLRRHPERSVADSQDVLEGAEREVGRMRRLVEDLLTLTRADAGHLALNAEEVDVDDLVRDVVSDARPGAARTGHPVRITGTSAGRVHADADRVRQLLLALLDNAYRHTPESTPIEVGAARRGREVVIEVADRGPGIPEDQREAAFERFRRGGSGRATEGAGLGLAIVREIAQAHGGTVRLLDNRPGLRVQLVLPVGRGRPGTELSGPEGAGSAAPGTPASTTDR